MKRLFCLLLVVVLAFGAAPLGASAASAANGSVALQLNNDGAAEFAQSAIRLPPTRAALNLKLRPIRRCIYAWASLTAAICPCYGMIPWAI